MEASPVAHYVSNGSSTRAARERLRGWELASVLAALMLTLLLAALDQTIVSTALPRILSQLHGEDRYTWVVTSYLLTSTTMIPIVGKLSDQFGRKWFVVIGVIIFLIGSALSGASQSMNQLIIYRGLQGIGAGMVLAMVFTLVGDIFTPVERAKWQGLFTSMFALASVVGPTLGGYLTDNGPLLGSFVTDATRWRWVFYVNLPVGVIALVFLLRFLPANISARSTNFTGWAAVRRVDFAGSLTAAGATTCLLLGLTFGGQTYPWNSAPVIGTLAGAVVLYAAFAYIEARVAVEPLLPLDLFRNQIFTAGALLSLTVGAALLAVSIYLPLFIQGVMGLSATSSGAAVTPLTLTLAAASVTCGLIISRLGRYQVISIIGAVIMAVGIFLLTRLNSSSNLLEVSRDMVVVGLGLGMVQPVLTLAVQNAIPRTRLGVGTGAVTYLRSLGSTLGLAVIGTVVNGAFSGALPAHLPAAARQLPPSVLALATSQGTLVAPGLKQQLTAGVVQAAVARIPPGPDHTTLAAQVTAQVTTLMNQIFEATRQSLAVGIQQAFWVAFGIAIAIALITVFLKDVPLRGSIPTPQPVGAEPVIPPAVVGAKAE
ncbi:MAG TPA: MDR family MFS transporter [Ktedonobacterales bacterium]|nr:MDR family MFS transporter [Ktedonobacterales bacterium]